PLLPLHSHVHHPTLPSFPTRRSSDLHRHVPDGFEDVVLAQTRLSRHCCLSHAYWEAAPAVEARLVRSASRAPTTFISKPFSAPTNPAIGACSVPPSWASSSMRDGRLASRLTC